MIGEYSESGKFGDKVPFLANAIVFETRSRRGGVTQLGAG
jgi:hypothetical protein